MSSRWYVWNGSNRLGPFTDEQLRELAAKGEVTADTSVAREGETSWRPFRKLASPAAQTPPPTSAPWTRLVVGISAFLAVAVVVAALVRWRPAGETEPTPPAEEEVADEPSEPPPTEPD